MRRIFRPSPSWRLRCLGPAPGTWFSGWRFLWLSHRSARLVTLRRPVPETPKHPLTQTHSPRGSSPLPNTHNTRQERISNNIQWWLKVCEPFRIYIYIYIILVTWFGSTCPHYEWIITANQFYPRMKPFSHDGSGLFRDDSAPNYMAGELTEWRDEDENDVICYGFHSPDLNQMERLWEILKWRESSPAPWSKHQLRDFFFFFWKNSSVHHSSTTPETRFGGSWWPNTLLTNLFL